MRASHTRTLQSCAYRICARKDRIVTLEQEQALIELMSGNPVIPDSILDFADFDDFGFTDFDGDPFSIIELPDVNNFGVTDF